jgi:hypothetical protein
MGLKATEIKISGINFKLYEPSVQNEFALAYFWHIKCISPEENSI